MGPAARKIGAIVAAATMMLSTSSVATSPAAHAGSGLNQWKWGDAGITLSSSSYQHSNMSGFWQAVVNSNNCPIVVDGIYGNVTTWHTAVFQNEVLGGNNGGVLPAAAAFCDGVVVAGSA